MYGPGSNGQLGMSALIYVLVIAFIVWRMMRPMRMTVGRMLVRPVILLLLTGLAIWGEQMASPSPPWELAAVMIGGFLVGTPLGILRGKHSEIKLTDRPGIFYVHSSPLIIMVWLAAFVGRAAIRYFLPDAGKGATIWTLGLLAFAVGALLTSAYAIYVKYKDMAQAPGQQQPTASS